MQRTVSFHVTYSEYINYILSLQQDCGIKLIKDYNYLKTLASCGHPSLYAHFLQDVSFGIMKELSYAEKYKKPASIILPASYNGNNIDIDTCIAGFPFYMDFTEELKRIVTQAGFKLPKVYQEQNLFLFKLAVVLYALGKNPSGLKEVNIVYNT